ncbi:MAG: sensor histidine kinase [Bilifractor sp.]|jgi:signal transduction histidine kinase
MRIMLLLIIMGIVPALIIEGVIVRTQVSRAVSQRTITVQNQCTILCDQLANLGYLENPVSDVIDAELSILTNIYGGRIMIVNSDYKIVKDTFRLDRGKYILSQPVIDCFNGEETSRYDKKNQYIEIALKITDPDGDSKDVAGVMLISVSTTEIQVTKDLMEQRAILILAILIAVILVLGYFLSGVLVKPFQKISSSIEALADGYSEESISVPDYLETEMITNAFNRMMRRIRTMDDSREEFVANVSHELKTPLASMKVLADALNSNPDVPVEQYQDFMQDISQEIDRENQIITDLLSLVKMDRKAQDLNIETVNINEMLSVIIKRLNPLAKRQNVELLYESFRPVNAEIDQTKIALAITNIIENAIKYNKPEGGWVRTSLNADHKYFYVTIADSGIGIPEDSLDHIFDRFYRVDKSHSREIGGTGLGLAISRSAIVMHRGAIKVYSREGEGTTFSIRVPLVYIV